MKVHRGSGGIAPLVFKLGTTVLCILKKNMYNMLKAKDFFHG